MPTKHPIPPEVSAYMSRISRSRENPAGGRPRSTSARCRCEADTIARATRRAAKSGPHQGTCPPGDGHQPPCPFYRAAA